MSYTVLDHLLDRLTELGIDRLFGVPGDFTLAMLDHVVAHPGLEWTGCTNELNAGYAADGYARLRGAGALMTTFGVGELSALNAVAGSYAEHVPVLHIVGAPATTTQATGRAIHHTLGDGDFSRFAAMYEAVTCASAVLTADDAVAEIDRVLTEMRTHRRPGYLMLPLDVAESLVPPATVPLPPIEAQTDATQLVAFRGAAARVLDRAADVTVLAGVLVHRFGARAALAEVLASAPVRSATTLWGKSIVDETRTGHLGVYAGAASSAAVRSAVEDAGALIVAGVEITDLNSGFFTHHFNADRTIELRPDAARVGTTTFPGVSLATALTTLRDLLVDRTDLIGAEAGLASLVCTPDTTVLDQESLWSTVAAGLAPGDIVLADQGTAFYGLAPHRLPRDVTFIGQPLWASIGYTLPAALGAGLAGAGRRVVLLIGDGAAQMTVSELSTIVACGIEAVVVIVDNSGYTIERAIHGPDQPYNDIAAWDWVLLARAFAADPRTPAPRGVFADSAVALGNAFGRADGTTLVHACVDRMDVPPLLEQLAAAAGAANTVEAVAYS